METPAERKVWTLAPPFQHESGRAWLAPLPVELCTLTDSSEAPHRSRLRLLEDGQEIGRPHSPHGAIRAPGQGRYSFWGTDLYFSTPDNSDPNGNGRTYGVTLRPAAIAAGFAAGVPDIAPGQWQPPARPLRCAVLGLGNRGIALAGLAHGFAGVELRWLCDRSRHRLGEVAERIAAPGLRLSTDMTEPIADPAVDIVFVALPDHLHRSAAEPALRAGKDVYLEKPVATTIADARAILTAWRDSGRILNMGYVLRATPFYRAVRRVLRGGLLGPVRLITTSEQLDALHGASFMRRWHAESRHSGGLMVHKGCHDLDLICWLMGTRPLAVASFGGNATFARPAPAPFCSQCGERGTCPYADAGLHESRSAAEWADPTAFGLDRCVFGAHKDIVDHQVVAFELENAVRGSFTLSVQNPLRTERRITIVGDAGRLDGALEDGRFTVQFVDPEQETLQWSAEGADRGGHQGGDQRMMRAFLDACLGRAPADGGTAEEILAGLVFAIAAEEARRTDGVVRLDASDFSLSDQHD